MKILVVNCGSSSLKYKLFECPKCELLSKGSIEKIGEKNSSVQTHTEGVKLVLEKLIKEKALDSVDEINAVGHRVVHGGEVFHKPHIIDEKVIAEIKKCAKFAPLHNPANLAGIMACKKILHNIRQVAVFDTAFHQTIPDYAYMYALPMKYYKKHGVRRYGFHGTSHSYLADEAARIMDLPLNKLKLITCHLGNGCSITAIDKGKSIDTSMGFTPLEGLIMGTRAGDIDPAVLFYVMEREKLSPEKMDEVMNRKSGLLGISGISNDMREIQAAKAEGDERARLAIDMFTYRIKKYIGAYMMALGGVDAVCFSGGIGENDIKIVNDIKKSVMAVVSDKTKVMVIPTDEELMIAKLTSEIVEGEK
ncbi:MAG: acetate kinase [Candidatus Omnitrophica bacterium]|nr:acetate kinase [Candidatus Omnitrophota bacterium]MDD5080559.1 acetate kinase [Candidatus Omnitrophota bacterium]MDD5441279.1 acetate kinase [Candidatus Omnitrophota bacterium]